MLLFCQSIIGDIFISFPKLNENDRKCYKYVKRIGPRDPRICDSPTILINSYGDYICADPTTAAYPITCPSKGDNYTAKTDQIDHYCTYHDLIPYIRTCRAGDERINNKCYESTKYNASYSCTSGYTLSGTKCTKAETSTVKYSCPAGYELQINTCYKYDIKAMK